MATFISLIGVLNKYFGKKTPVVAAKAEPQTVKIIVNQDFLVLDGDSNWTQLEKGSYELTPLDQVENDPLDGSPVAHDQNWYRVSFGGFVLYVNNLWLELNSKKFSPLEKKMILDIL